MKQGQTPAVPTLETCLAYAEEQAKKFHKDEVKPERYLHDSNG